MAIQLLRFDGERDLCTVIEDHSKYCVIEDKLHLLMQNSDYNFKQLRIACLPHLQQYDQKESYHLAQIMKQTTYDGKPYNSRVAYYKEQGFNDDDANSCAYILSFYTGEFSETVSRGASINIRGGNMPRGTEGEENIRPILFYMLKALSVIPFYWGVTNRAVNLTREELYEYEPGMLVTWIQFSSSKVGLTVATGGGFNTRNTVFIIYSLTGRRIQHLSNYVNEDEVLFLPHSHFLVVKKQDIETINKENKIETKYHIYLRQVELGLSQMTILWVDDRILEPNWENRKHMEKASAHHVVKNIRFVPKTNTDAAISFLRSPFGKRLIQLDGSQFRIISDMTRENEKPSHNAGARFLRKIREMRIKNPVLIFTSDKKKALGYISTEFSKSNIPMGEVTVTTSVHDAEKFIQFDVKN